MGVYQLVHSLRRGIKVQMMIEPVRSYGRDTLDSFERYRLTAFRDPVLQFTIECRWLLYLIATNTPGIELQEWL